MANRDHIGHRGENIFRMLITRCCRGRYYFHETFLGEKHEATDFSVELIGATRPLAQFYVQVKATTTGYSGAGRGRALNVAVTAEDMAKLRAAAGPAYVVGIDVPKERGYILAVDDASGGGLRGLPTRHPLHCGMIPGLWAEVDRYWIGRDMMLAGSKFRA